MSKPQVDICMGSSCFARGNKENLQAIMRFLEHESIEDGVDLTISGSLCQGSCRKGPNITIDGEIITVESPSFAVELIKKSFSQRKCEGE